MLPLWTGEDQKNKKCGPLGGFELVMSKQARLVEGANFVEGRWFQIT